MAKMILTNEEKEKFEQWIIENVSDQDVPSDEGNTEALIYNLVHHVRGDNKRYDYQWEQDEEVTSWGILIG